jgi:hypothetical protein
MGEYDPGTFDSRRQNGSSDRRRSQRGGEVAYLLGRGLDESKRRRNTKVPNERLLASVLADRADDWAWRRPDTTLRDGRRSGLTLVRKPQGLRRDRGEWV